mmetsp:Transcript_3936/g.8048  ORF Transcript_3936/g.8048 Transcript_3936/m.8048 type:complete len:380 (-) Transcript_3936:108-1247(-)
MMYNASNENLPTTTSSSSSPPSPISNSGAAPGLSPAMANLISFHCIICYDDFNFSDRTPMVLPCGHTFVCLTCTKQLKRCMECREPLFVPVASSSGQCDSSKENASRRQHLDRQSSAPLSLREMRNMRRAAATTFVSPQTMNNNQGKQEMAALPVPKNLVLLTLMEASGLRQKQKEEVEQAEAQSTAEDRQIGEDHVGQAGSREGSDGDNLQQPLLDHVHDQEGEDDQNIHFSLRPSVQPPTDGQEEDCGCTTWQASEAVSQMMDEEHHDDETDDIMASSVVVESGATSTPNRRQEAASHPLEEDVEIVSLNRGFSDDEEESMSSDTVTAASSTVSLQSRSPNSPSFVNFRTGLSGHHALTSNLPKKRMLSMANPKVHF